MPVQPLNVMAGGLVRNRPLARGLVRTQGSLRTLRPRPQDGGFTRASDGWRMGNASTWESIGANLPRAHYTPGGVLLGTLLEPQRTNAVRNPRGEGAASGTLPTSWGIQGSSANVSVVGPAILAGIPGILLQIAGTGNGLNTALTFDSDLSVATAAGETWTAGLTVALVSGSLAGLSNIQLSIRTNGSASPASLTLTPTADLTRATLPTVMGSGTTAWVPRLFFTQASGVAINAVLFLGAPQAERAEAGSSIILPPPGTIAASSRAQDIWIVPRAQLLPNMSRATVLLRWRPDPGVLFAYQTLFALSSDSGGSRRYAAMVPGGSSDVAGQAGPPGADLPGGLGTLLRDGSVQRYAMTWGPGRVAHCLNGGTVRAMTSNAGPASNDMADGLRLFSEAAGLAPHPCIVESVAVLPRLLGDAELQTLTAG